MAGIRFHGVDNDFRKYGCISLVTSTRWASQYSPMNVKLSGNFTPLFHLT